MGRGRAEPEGPRLILTTSPIEREGGGGFEGVGETDAGGHIGEDGVISKFAVAKQFMKVLGGETTDLWTEGFRAFTGHDRGCSWRGLGGSGDNVRLVG